MIIIDYDALYDKIDGIWPLKRTKAIKDLEKQKIQESIFTEEDVSKLINKVEIEIEDKKPNKLPTLLNLITSIVDQRIVDFMKVEIPVLGEELKKRINTEAENLFEEIYCKWPENEYKQNRKFAKEAFLDATKKYSLSDIKAACECYIRNNTDPSSASLGVLGIKRFVSEDDILDNWIKKSKTVVSDYDVSFFNAAWAWYPEFKDNDKEEVKKDSLSFYKRFIKDNDVIDFYCAVKAYRSERIQESKNSEDLEDEEKYTKKFYNFIRNWKTYNCASHKCDLLIGLFVKVFKESNIPYWIVYPEDNHYSAVLHCCKQKNEKGEYVSCVEIIGKHFDNVTKYLTSGENYCNLQVDVSVDYGIVSKIISLALSEAKKMPHKPIPEC